LIGRLRPDEVVPAEPVGQKHGVAQARYRHQLGNTLEEAEHNGLEVAHDAMVLELLAGTIRWVPARPEGSLAARRAPRRRKRGASMKSRVPTRLRPATNNASAKPSICVAVTAIPTIASSRSGVGPGWY